MINKIKIFLSSIHFYVIALCLFFQALTLSEGYRVFAYTNLILVLISVMLYRRQYTSFNTGVLLGGLLLLVFIGMEWLAATHFAVKMLRHVLLAVGLMTGIALLSVHHEWIKPKLMPVLTWAIYAYTIFQCIAIYLLERPDGTTKNPHYLAIYCAIFFVISIYLIIQNKSLIHRSFLGASSFFLGVFLLDTSSRPIWIALLLAMIMTACCLKRRTALILLVGSSLLFAGLAMTNAGNFKSRWEDLILNASTEERVTIWQDAWQMQESNSNHFQWIFGHGVESFARDFPSYSRYYVNEKIDFNSPHNILLELLYQFGIMGVVLIMSGVALLYYRIVSAYLRRRITDQHAWVYLLLLMVLTIDFFSVSITLPFFISINLNMLALVAGATIYLNNIGKC